MKQLLLGAAVCLGILAFTKINTGNHFRACDRALVLSRDTVPSKDTTKPKSQVLALNSILIPNDTVPKDTNRPKSQVLLALYAHDTTPSKDTVKPKAFISYASLYRNERYNDTTPSKDTSKPKISMVQVSFFAASLKGDTTPSKPDTTSKPKMETSIAWASR